MLSETLWMRDLPSDFTEIVLNHSPTFCSKTPCLAPCYSDVPFRASALRADCMQAVQASVVFHTNSVTKLLFTAYVLTLIEIRHL